MLGQASRNRQPGAVSPGMIYKALSIPALVLKLACFGENNSLLALRNSLLRPIGNLPASY
jgi:hypothetical protein